MALHVFLISLFLNSLVLFSVIIKINVFLLISFPRKIDNPARMELHVPFDLAPTPPTGASVLVALES